MRYCSCRSSVRCLVTSSELSRRLHSSSHSSQVPWSHTGRRYKYIGLQCFSHHMPSASICLHSIPIPLLDVAHQLHQLPHGFRASVSVGGYLIKHAYPQTGQQPAIMISPHQKLQESTCDRPMCDILGLRKQKLSNGMKFFKCQAHLAVLFSMPVFARFYILLKYTYRMHSHNNQWNYKLWASVVSLHPRPNSCVFVLLSPLISMANICTRSIAIVVS